MKKVFSWPRSSLSRRFRQVSQETYKIVNCARLWSSAFFLRCWSRVALLNEIKPELWASRIGATFGVLALLLGTAAPALSAEKFCSDPPYFGVIDGNIRPVPTQITIDRDCTFLNFPQSKPLTTTINFHTNDPTIYLIIFDNVIFTGHMACANVDHRIWFSNSSDYSSSNACQDLFIPVETIDKKNPEGQTTATIGVPFTYTLTLPSMSLGGGPSANDLHSVAIWDDLTATGADLTYVDINAYYKGSGAPVTLVPENDPSAPGGVWTPKNLSYKKIPLIRAGEQIVIEITVVIDDTARNAPGTQFTNTAKWQFGRLIDGTYYEPLPGEWGHTAPMTIVEPNLVVAKTGSTSVINLGEWAEFTLDVWNSGTWAGDAWNVNIFDRLPSEPSNHPFNGGMCDLTPEVTGVTLAGRPLTLNTDYLLSYAGCELSLTLLEAAGPIEPNERLIISYRTKVDADSESGAVLTNVAAATRWSNDEDDTIGQTYTCSLTDGTTTYWWRFRAISSKRPWRTRTLGSSSPPLCRVRLCATRCAFGASTSRSPAFVSTTTSTRQRRSCPARSHSQAIPWQQTPHTPAPGSLTSAT